MYLSLRIVSSELNLSTICAINSKENLYLRTIYRNERDQPPDVVVNGPLKKMIREEYHKYVTELCSDSKQSAYLKAGEKIPVSREKMVGFIESAYKRINDVNKKNRWIADSFQTCGLDPWSDNTKNVFEAHLEKLSESQVYQALIEQHTAVQLCRSAEKNSTIVLTNLKTIR